jgi:hypothetical protein
MNARSSRVAPLVLALASATWANAASRADEPLPEAAPPAICDGEYRYVGDEAERAARLRAIEDVVGGMNVLVRSIARARLERSTRIIERLGVERAGTRTSITLDGLRYTTLRDDEPVATTAATGEKVLLRHHLDGFVVVQRLDGEQGWRENRYSCRGLRLEVRIHSPRLPRDLVYRLTYGR